MLHHLVRLLLPLITVSYECFSDTAEENEAVEKLC